MKTNRRRTAGFDVETFFPSRLAQLSERISKGLSAIYTERFGLTVPEWRVLAWLSQQPSLSARDISRLANLDRATLSRAVQRLSDRKLLKRATHPEDQRVHTLSLTPQAKQLLSELLPLALEWEAGVLETFTGKELRQLQKLFAKLEARLGQ